METHGVYPFRFTLLLKEENQLRNKIFGIEIISSEDFLRAFTTYKNYKKILPHWPNDERVTIGRDSSITPVTAKLKKSKLRWIPAFLNNEIYISALKKKRFCFVLTCSVDVDIQCWDLFTHWRFLLAALYSCLLFPTITYGTSVNW